MKIPNNVSPEAKRMYYIRALQQRLLSGLFDHAKKKLEAAMWLIAEKNQMLLKCNTPTFVYNGRWYPMPKPPNPTEANKRLHPDLHGEVIELLTQVNHNDQEIKRGIETLISNVLCTAKHTADLDRLLPDAALGLMPIIDSDIFNTEAPMTDDQIKEFQEANAINLKFFNQMLLTQLILNKV
jgi:hypothetical protein